MKTKMYSKKFALDFYVYDGIMPEETPSFDPHEMELLKGTDPEIAKHIFFAKKEFKGSALTHNAVEASSNVAPLISKNKTRESVMKPSKEPIRQLKLW